MAQAVSSEKKFVPVVLPWVVAGGALILYILTLNPWVSLFSLPEASRVAGWGWQSNVTQPFYWLLTSPIRLLPPSVIPLALNVFAAICGVLTLALLARSVALLPHDRTEQQRIREKSPFSLLSISTSWVPPVLAVLVCGLQLSFWENATAASSDMLDLLIFAYVIRCLLEFRINGRDSWLVKASLVYGIGMANNWAMIGFFPVYLAALIWIKGFEFLNGTFLVRAFFAGLAGLSLYLLLPLVNALSGPDQLGFWPALKANLSLQKNYLTAFVFSKWNVLQGDRPLWVLALYSLLPVLALSIRWPAFTGDVSKLGLRLANLSFNLLFGFLLLLCVFVALDPQFSPRHYQPALLQYGMKLLPFYYLGALSVGYFSGFFLLVFGARPSGRTRLMKHYPAPISATVVGGVFLLLAVVPLLLLLRNFPMIRATNGPTLRQYTSLVAEALPAQGAVVLSDDARKLVLAEAAAARAGKPQNHVFLDTASLVTPEYHRFLKKRYPGIIPEIPLEDVTRVSDTDLQMMVAKLAQTKGAYYLHPSFGYYFEVLCPEAHGLIYKLNFCPSDTLVFPAAPKESIAENEAFWAKADGNVLQPIQSAVEYASQERASGFAARLAEKLHLAKEPNRQALLLATFYSQARNYWGGEMQKSGHLKEAAGHFQRALTLNPDNLVAKINLECNGKLQSGGKASVELSKMAEENLSKRYRSWDQVIRENGPFDEPSFCFA
ncbi:MAG TPA: DUF2723 domain-containing protein, partial [Clostridia bacterium]|nr:DUF2723 domain-containing protein [Clostridia bacterium]